jgi:hypothetical protein
MSQSWLFDFDALSSTSNSNNLNNLIKGVWEESDNQKPIQEIDWDSMSRFHLSASDLANTSVGGEDDDWSEIGLKGSIEVSEALNIKHVHLIDEEDTWYKLSNTVINVFVDDFVDFESELLGDLSLFWSVNLSH